MKSSTMKLFDPWHGHALLLLFVVQPFSSIAALQAQTMHATRVAQGLSLPVFATAAPGDTNRLFILEQRSGPGDDTGRIQILDLNTGAMNPIPFLSVPGLSNNSEEQGLLGLAFHPDYANNGFFYLTESFQGHTDIVRYQVSPGDPDIAMDGSGTTILSYSQPHPCHNGNWLGFGPDGMLYHTSGDGGSQHDGFGNAQNKTTLNGSVVRIDVGADGLADDFPADPNRNYSIPASNPFVGEGGGVREELWSIGLRNPWRASFDRRTGDFYIGDTSQDTLEEINFQHAGAAGGQNYGWPLREGTIATPTGNPSPGGPKPPGAMDPIYEYLHTSKTGTIGSATANGSNQGNSVIGGYVYRGPVNVLNNEYFFADFVTGRIWSFEFDGTEDPADFNGQNHSSSFRNWSIVPDAGSARFFSSFGEDADGNLYVMNYVSGELFRFDPTNYFDADFELDLDVDGSDLAVWGNAFGTDATYGDADADADTDGNDFLVWQRQFGAQLPPPPEPGPITWTSGVSGSWFLDSEWSDTVGSDPQNALTTFGSANGCDSSENKANATILIDGSAGSTNVLYDSDLEGDDFRMTSNGTAAGSLILSGGATLEIRSTTTPDGLWTEIDAALLKVTGPGSELVRSHTDPNKNGGAFVFGSWRSVQDQRIDLKVLDHGSIDNEGQMWFGAYNSSAVDLVVTWEVGRGASVHNHDALGGGVSLDHTAGSEGEINFIWNFDAAAGAADDSTYTIDMTGHGGSLTVGAEGIRYQKETAQNVWTSTMKTYQQLWADGRLTASTSTQGEVFGDNFAVVGSSGLADYKVINIQGASMGGSDTADINGDFVVDTSDYNLLAANFGTGTTVAEGDINLAAPGDERVDAADVGILFAAFAVDPGSAVPGTAIAQYDPATGQIVVSVSDVNNWYVESASASLTGAVPTGLPGAGGLVSDNDVRVGESMLALFSYTDKNLGNLAVAGLPVGDLKIFWNAGLGQPVEMQSVVYLDSAVAVVVPEPTSLGLFLLAVLGFSGLETFICCPTPIAGSSGTCHTLSGLTELPSP